MNGNYLNRRGIRGYCAQFKCGHHWCKVSVSHADQHSARISLKEFDDLATTTLLPAVTIPLASIAAALRSSAAEAASLGSILTIRVSKESGQNSTFKATGT